MTNIGECGGAHSRGRRGVKEETKKQRVETQQGSSRQSTGEAYLGDVGKLVLWSCYACSPTPCLALNSALKCSFVSQPYHTWVSHPDEHTQRSCICFLKETFILSQLLYGSIVCTFALCLSFLRLQRGRR